MLLIVLRGINCVPVNLKSKSDMFLNISNNGVTFSDESTLMNMDSSDEGIKLYKEDKQLCKKDNVLAICEEGDVFEVEQMGEFSRIKKDGLCMTASEKVLFEECSEDDKQLFKIDDSNGDDRKQNVLSTIPKKEVSEEDGEGSEGTPEKDPGDVSEDSKKDPGKTEDEGEQEPLKESKDSESPKDIDQSSDEKPGESETSLDKNNKVSDKISDAKSSTSPVGEDEESENGTGEDSDDSTVKNSDEYEPKPGKKEDTPTVGSEDSDSPPTEVPTKDDVSSESKDLVPKDDPESTSDHKDTKEEKVEDSTEDQDSGEEPEKEGKKFKGSKEKGLGTSKNVASPSTPKKKSNPADNDDKKEAVIDEESKQVVKDEKLKNDQELGTEYEDSDSDLTDSERIIDKDAAKEGDLPNPGLNDALKNSPQNEQISSENEKETKNALPDESKQLKCRKIGEAHLNDDEKQDSSRFDLLGCQTIRETPIEQSSGTETKDSQKPSMNPELRNVSDHEGTHQVNIIGPKNEVMCIDNQNLDENRPRRVLPITYAPVSAQKTTKSVPKDPRNAIQTDNPVVKGRSKKDEELGQKGSLCDRLQQQQIGDLKRPLEEFKQSQNADLVCLKPQTPANPIRVVVASKDTQKVINTCSMGTKGIYNPIASDKIRSVVIPNKPSEYTPTVRAELRPTVSTCESISCPRIPIQKHVSAQIIPIHTSNRPSSNPQVHLIPGRIPSTQAGQPVPKTACKRTTSVKRPPRSQVVTASNGKLLTELDINQLNDRNYPKREDKMLLKDNITMNIQNRALHTRMKIRDTTIKPQNFSYNEDVDTHEPLLFKRKLYMKNKVIPFSPTKRIEGGGDFVLKTPDQQLDENKRVVIGQRNAVQTVLTDKKVSKMEIGRVCGKRALEGAQIQKMVIV